MNELGTQSIKSTFYCIIYNIVIITLLH